MSPTSRVLDEVRALEQLGLEQLREEWRRRYGPPPKLRSPMLMRRILAWRLQSAALGGLEAKVRQGLNRRPASRSEAARLDADLRPGVKLTREWRGVVHEVTVVDGGFDYGGHVHRSLSAVATSIAGSRWNGPRFFGLRKAADL